MADSTNNDLLEATNDLEEITDEELALRKREISKHVGMIKRTANRLESSMKQLEADNDASEHSVQKARENYKNVSQQAEQLQEISEAIRDEVDRRDIDVWKYYNGS